MTEKTITLAHLEMAALRSMQLSSEVAAAAGAAIEELAARSATMEQVNAAIAAAVDRAIEEAY